MKEMVMISLVPHYKCLRLTHDKPIARELKKWMLIKGGGGGGLGQKWQGAEMGGKFEEDGGKEVNERLA